MPPKGSSRKQLKPTEHPTSLDIAWAAGVFEGEGHCWPSRGSTGLHVSQKTAWLPRRLCSLFGGSARLYSSGTYRGKPQKMWRWYAYGSRARGFLMTIYKFLSPFKQEQIRTALRCSKKEKT